MGRRWVVQVDTVTVDASIPQSGVLGHATRQQPRYLGVAHHHGPDKDKLMPVRVSYAKLFVTKREALATAEELGFNPEDPDVKAMRKWW